MKRIKASLIFLTCAVLFYLCAFCAAGITADQKSANSEPVELNGDSIEYKAAEGKMVATGNVFLKQNNTVLYCDKLEFYRDKKEAHAEGNVILETDKGKVWADKGFYNFDTKKGEFTNARLMADPVFGRARAMIKVGEDHYIFNDGYLTTSDLDDPEYRVKARSMDVYVGQKAVARNSVMYFGSVPVMYMPKYVQDLRTDRPHFSFIPGYSKNFGAYALTTYRTELTKRIETLYRFDLRELKGVAWGVDVKYNAAPFGIGLVRSYYTKESNTDSNRIWMQNKEPVVKHQRDRIEWRHSINLDPATSLVGQYYKQRDASFISEYFLREYRKDESPNTFAILTHTTPLITASLRADVRVNRYESYLGLAGNAPVERLPEVAVTFSNHQIGDTGFYLKSLNTASSLIALAPAPSDDQKRTMRFDTDNMLSRPFKVAFLEVSPNVGTEQTFYSRALDMKDNNSVRGVFKTGVDVSTKFYKVYNVHFDRWGVEVNNLRHVITPSVSLAYAHHPTMAASKLYQYDSFDSRSMSDVVNLGLENKIQTKRNGHSVDIFRSNITQPYRLNDDPSGTGLGDVKMDNEFYPNKYIALHSDVTYSNDAHELQTANGGLSLQDGKTWDLGLSRRYTNHQDDIVTAQLSYKLNPKWRTIIFQRWNVDSGQWQEQQYTFVRDLHSWEVEFAYLNKNGSYDGGGSEVWFIFRIKAFPTIGFNGGSSFNRQKTGSQSSFE